MMNAHGCAGDWFFLKYDIHEQGVGLIIFFNKKLVTIVLEPQLCNQGWKISRRLWVEEDTKICGVQQNIGLVLVLSKWQGCLRFMKPLKGVNERSYGNKTIFKFYKHKINSKQHND